MSSDTRVCYSCGKEATLLIESVGFSHFMTIWVCKEHAEPYARVLKKYSKRSGLLLARSVVDERVVFVPEEEE